jgi:hypothetical protein
LTSLNPATRLARLDQAPREAALVHRRISRGLARRAARPWHGPSAAADQSTLIDLALF